MKKVNTTTKRTQDKIGKCIHILLLLMLIMIVILVSYKILSLPYFNLKYGAINRQISDYLLQMDVEPNEKNETWYKNELPEFILDDMSYAEKHQIDDIIYEFNSNVIQLTYLDNVWVLSVNSPDSIMRFEDFSIYKTKNSDISIYGYCYDSLYQIKVGTTIEETLLTPYPDLPSGMLDSLSSYAYDIKKVGDYTLLYKDNTYTFYKDGVEISSYPFEEGTINTIESLSNGIITTSDNELFWIEVYMSNDKPGVQFQKVAEDIETVYNRSTLFGKVTLPIIKKSGKYYIMVADNWEMLKNSSIYTNNILPKEEIGKQTLSLIALEDCFSNANFSYSLNTWECDISFMVNNTSFIYEYSFNGYDDSIDLPDEIVEKYSITVNSMDSMWENIEGIRKEYYSLYEHQEDFS